MEKGKRNHKPAAVIMLDIIIDMYEWSDGCLGRKYEDLCWDNKWKRSINITQKDFDSILDYLGKHRNRIVTYRHYIISCYPHITDHPVLKFLRKL